MRNKDHFSLSSTAPKTTWCQRRCTVMVLWSSGLRALRALDKSSPRESTRGESHGHWKREKKAWTTTGPPKWCIESLQISESRIKVSVPKLANICWELNDTHTHKQSEQWVIREKTLWVFLPRRNGWLGQSCGHSCQFPRSDKSLTWRKRGGGR